MAVALIVLTLTGAWGQAAPRGLAWSFEAGPAGWQVGVSPLRYYTAADGPARAFPPGTAGGVLAVPGTRTEQIYMDTSGLVGRGTTLVQWLLAPELGAAAADFSRLTLRVRAAPGARIRWKVQWLTKSARTVLASHLRQRLRRQLPDSVRVVLEAYRQGRLSDRDWETFITRWQQGEGRDYAATTRRLWEEEILLRGLLETEERRFTGTGGWQDLSADLRAAAGWRGLVLGYGLHFALEPSTPDVLAPRSGADAPDAPFVWIGRVELERSTDSVGGGPDRHQGG